MQGAGNPAQEKWYEESQNNGGEEIAGMTSTLDKKGNQSKLEGSQQALDDMPSAKWNW